MKRLIIFVLLALSLIFLLTNCKKEEITPTQLSYELNGRSFNRTYNIQDTSYVEEVEFYNDLFKETITNTYYTYEDTISVDIICESGYIGDVYYNVNDLFYNIDTDTIIENVINIFRIHTMDKEQMYLINISQNAEERNISYKYDGKYLVLDAIKYKEIE